MKLSFELTVDGMTLLAAFVSELVRQGVTFTMRQDNVAVEVTLTGGF